MALSEFPTFDPGVLRHKITIEGPPATQTASGELTGSWTTLATVRARMEPMSGTEQLAAGVFNPEAMFEVTLRYLSGLTTNHRINWGGRLFEIVGVKNVLERNRWMVLTAREGRGHGN